MQDKQIEGRHCREMAVSERAIIKINQNLEAWKPAYVTGLTNKTTYS
jgi:hypothetical protein